MLMNMIIDNNSDLIESLSNTIFKSTNAFAGGNLTRTQSVSAPPYSKATPATVPSGVSITTSDAYTMTDGPSIFLADNVEI